MHLKKEKHAGGKFNQMKLTGTAAGNAFDENLSMFAIILKTSLINY